MSMTAAVLERPVTNGPLDETGTRLRWQAVGLEIRAARTARSMTQADLAQQVGIRQNILSEDERGREWGIPIHRLMAYADALQMDYELLVRMAYGRDDVPEAGSTFRSA